jgi:hypothetical protein
MRRALHILMLVAVFLCGAHPGEPAQAHEDPAQHILHLDSHMPDEDGGTGPSDADHVIHAGHQHCPLAADDRGAPFACEAPRADVPLFAPPVAALASLTRAPPLEPPAA